MTKQVPSKHDTTRTVISILPLATFHQWLIKLVDCSTPCANLTLVSLSFFFSNSSSNSNWNWYCLKTVMCFCVWVNDWVFFCFFYVFAKKKPKHFVWYFYSSALPVQLNMYNVTVSLFFCWQMAWWLSWIARAGPLQLLKVGCWRDWSCFFFFVSFVSFVLFIIDCTKKYVLLKMHDIGCQI